MAWKGRFAEGETLPSLAGEVTFEASVLTVDGAGLDDAGTPRERAARFRTLRAAVNIQPPRVAIVIDGKHLLLCSGGSSSGGDADEQLQVAKSLPLAPGSLSIELADDVAVLRVFAATLEDESWHTHETLVLRAATGGAAATARLMDALVAGRGESEGGSSASEPSAAAGTAKSAAKASENTQALIAPLTLLDDAAPASAPAAQTDAPGAALQLDNGTEGFAEGGDLAARVRDATELVGGVDAVASLLTVNREASAAAADAAEMLTARKRTQTGRNRRALVAAEHSTVVGAQLDASPLRAAIVYLTREEGVLNRVEASTKQRDAVTMSGAATAVEAQQQQRARAEEIRRALVRVQALEERVTHARKVQVFPVAPAQLANSAQKVRVISTTVTYISRAYPSHHLTCSPSCLREFGAKARGAEESRVASLEAAPAEH